MNVDDIHRLIKKFHFKRYNNSLNPAINQEGGASIIDWFRNASKRKQLNE